MRQRSISVSKLTVLAGKLELVWARFTFEATYQVSTRFCFEATGRLLEQFTDDREAGSIQTRELRKYLAHLMDEGLKKTSVAIHYRNLNSLFNWLKGEGILESSPMNDIKEPKTPDKFPKILNKEQVDKLLNTARNWRRTWAGYRNFTTIVTFLDTGFRLDEFVNAELNNLDFELEILPPLGSGY